MKKIILLYGLLVAFLPTIAQVQWANKVIAVSSEKKAKGNQFKAEQALGKPNVLPAFQDSPSAWSPEKDDNSKDEYIHVGFANPLNIKQVIIAESYNAGAISEILAYDETGKSNVLYKNPNPAFVSKGRLFSTNFPQTSYKVVSIKVILHTAKVAGENQIDAIGISENDKTFKAEVLVSKNAPKNRAEKLGVEVNTTYPEANPVITPDGKSLYFTRLDYPENIKDTIKGKVYYKQDIWVSEIDANGNFSKAAHLEAPVNNRQHNAAFTIAPNQSFILLNNKYLAGGILEKGLSIARKDANGKWGQPQPVNIEGYKNINFFAEFWLDKTGNVLVMTLEESDSKGGNDLYVSFKKGENTFSKPINMGRTINSAGEEATPWIDEDNQTLYFASNGFAGFGSFDIFVSKRLDDTWTNWSEPENMGASINSAGMDLYFSKHKKIGYFSSSGDIYKIKLLDPILVLNTKALNAKNNQLVSEAKITIEPIGKGKLLNEKNGDYLVFNLELKRKYKINVEAKGFFPKEEEVDASSLEEYTEINKEVLLTPLEKDQAIRLNKINFARAQAFILPESYQELNKVIKMMQDNPNVKIRLEGHTEIYGNKKALTKLSKERVINVKKYMVNKGISKGRIEYKAFGPSNPLTREDTEEARQLNRRVEIRIL
ncbi:MAG: OmpA family protein [Thermonemataceae bacterium]|nr:OmpA family protein [Thermonemataceae bacterium]